MLNMDPMRLPSYLRGASDAELATLAQQARSPQILTAVQDEMSRREGGLTQNDMVPPPGGAQQVQQPVMPAVTLKDVASEGWVPPWERQDGSGPFITAMQSAGPVPDDDGPSFEEYGRSMPNAGSALITDTQSEGPVPDDDVPDSGARTQVGRQPVRGAVTRTNESPYSAGNGPVRPAAMSDLPEIDVGYAPGVGPDSAEEDIDLPPQTVALAKSLEEASDDPDAMQAILAEIQGSIQSPDEMRNNSIARAGFAMAASRNPYFFGALGEGGLAGMDAYEKSKQEALLNRVRSADIRSDMDKFSEQKRATGVSEQDAEKRLGLAERNVVLAEKDYQTKQQQYNDGKITNEALAQAEVRLKNAQADYYGKKDPSGSSTGSVLTQIGTDSDGNPIMGWQSVGKHTESENTAGSRAAIIGIGLDSAKDVNWDNVNPGKMTAVGIGEKLLGEDLGALAASYGFNEDEARLAAAQGAIQEGITAAITGAAYTERQAKNYAKIFVPQAGDSPDRRVEKLRRAQVLMTQLDRAARQQHITIDDLKPADVQSVIEGVVGETTSQPEPEAPAASAPAAPVETPDNLPVMQTPEDARKLPPGTWFLTPEGKRKMVPNG